MEIIVYNFNKKMALINNIILISLLIVGSLNEDCSNLNGEYSCVGDQREYPTDWDERSFQTPPRDDPLGNYRETYQDMNLLVGYSQLLYSSLEIKFICGLSS